MLLDLLHDLGLGLLFIFIAFALFDWSRIWWYARRHGIIRFGKERNIQEPYRWQREYLGYKVWTWLVRVVAWLASLWQLILGLCFLVQAITWSTVS